MISVASSLRVSRALVVHELLERARDRWVLIVAGAAMMVLVCS